MTPRQTVNSRRFFDGVDLEGLSRELDPRRRGRTRGEVGQPDLDAARDPEETRIVEAIKTRVQRATDQFRDLRAQAQRDFEEAQRQGQHDATDLHAARREGETALDRILLTRQPSLHEVRLEHTKQRQDLADFREGNRLQREPSYPPAWTRRLMGVGVFLLGILETIWNGNFLAVGDEGGLFGGITVAATVSLLNLLPASFFVGPFSRHLMHVRIHWRVLAALVVVVYLGFIVVLNLGVAHYRDLSGALATNIEAQVVDRLRADPMGLADAQSWLLFALGILASLIAFFEGWKRDDRYPGYGARHRAVVKAGNDYEDEVSDVSDELEKTRSKALDDIKRVVSEAKQALPTQVRISQRIRDMIRALDEHMAALEGAGHHLIGEYRAGNREARAGGGVPACHRVEWTLVVPEIDRSVPQPRAEAPLDAVGLTDAFRQATDRINDRYEQIRAQLFEPGSRRAPDAPDAELTSTPLLGP